MRVYSEIICDSQGPEDCKGCGILSCPMHPSRKGKGDK